MVFGTVFVSFAAGDAQFDQLAGEKSPPKKALQDRADALRGLTQQFGSGEDKTDVMADGAEYNFSDVGDDSGWTTFKGNVAIRYKGYELRADRIRYNVNTGDAEATGNVALVGEDGTLWKGDELAVNLKKKAGHAKNLDLYTDPFRIIATGGSIDAGVQTNSVYEIENALITTCSNDVDHLHYSVKASRARIRPGDDVTAWGVTPRLFGVPFFYIPYYWKDLLNHYGFRFQPGYKSSWGAYLLSTYKFPIVRDKVAGDFIDSYTFFDYRSDRGFAYGEKIKWEFANGESFGFLTGYYLPDDDDLHAGTYPLDTDDRYRVRLEHTWNATERDQVLIQALYVSDTRMQRDFFKREYRVMTEPDNFASWTHYSETWSAGATARFRLNDFYDVVEQLPEVWFDNNSAELWDSGVYMDNTFAAGFYRRRFAETAETDEENSLIEAGNYDAFRADANVMLSYPRTYFGFLSLVPRAGYRATWYSKTKVSRVEEYTETHSFTNELGKAVTTTETKERTVYDEGDSDLRSLLEFGLEATSRGYGFWTGDDGATWRHVIEPYANWTYIPEPNLRPDDLWTFDSIDKLDRTHALRLGYRQRWQRKAKNAAAFEPFYLDTWVDLNLDDEFEETETFAGCGLDARYRPAKWLQFKVYGEYDNQEELLHDGELSLAAWHDVFRCTVQYLYNEEADGEKNSCFQGGITWYPNERWGFHVYGRYEFESSQVEEVGAWIQHVWDCIGIRTAFGVEPGYTDANGIKEKDDWSFAVTGWLTDLTPDSMYEEDER